MLKYPCRCGVSKDIIASYVFKQGSAGITANSERYVTMLRNILQSQFDALGINMAEIFFQQDGVIGCMSNAAMVVV